MFTIFVKACFNASHQLRFSDGTVEDLHSHDWKITAAVSAEKLNEDGLVMDFNVLSRDLNKVVSVFEGKKLEEVEELKHLNGSVSTEKLAEYIFEKLGNFLPKSVKLYYIDVEEQADCIGRFSA